ncbi:proteasome-type protease [Phaeobacter sp. 22II1-1F12B]|uniref:proteasome-type protease n=1 Tax=Phaeobacter sp. 22II1-1F12B TaxID=1317111 RepID=UPI000B520095|nr:proteasome-type protease [Phaeobacter sp. 22II1-1F12B]OWU79103.1 peptidase [Phaeobacter sp. 22II1-1F12B]
MTYCVGLSLDRGLVFMSDTRTNAGVDNFSVTRKMFTFEVPGERFITIMTAGNLATTQALISLLEERSKAASDRDPTILKVPSMFQVARLIGATLKEIISDSTSEGQTSDAGFRATLIVGGQIEGGPPRLFLIYPEGNFVEATEDTPFFQIGETKYGKPILVRTYDRSMSFNDAAKLLLVSFDSTVKANLSVGLPFDLITYEKDTFQVHKKIRIEQDDPMYHSISTGWGDALRAAFDLLPSYEL